MEYFANYPAGTDVEPVSWAVEKEAEGWHGICASDHFWVGATRYPHVFVAATQMACATQRIKLTTSFCNNLFRSPVEFAQAALSLKAESYLRDYGHLQSIQPNPVNVITDAVSQAAVSMAANLGAAAIVSLTTSGFTSRQISKHRPDCPILAITERAGTARRLAMNWGVTPLLCGEGLRDREKIDFALASARELALLRDGDLVVVTAGYHQRTGTTDQIRVIRLEDSAPD